MEVFLADLLQEQRRQGLDAHALVHGDPLPDDPAWVQRVPVQFTLVYAPMALGFRRALKHAIRRLQPDVLHLHMPNNSALWALTLSSARKIPWVVHWHSDVVSSTIDWKVALAYRLYRPFEQALLEQAQQVFVTSPPYLEASTALQPWRGKCRVVPLGINLRQTLPPSIAPAESLTWHPGTQLRLLSIGRLTYYKGFETLIRAVATLPGVELLIAGSGEQHAALQALINQVTPAGTRPATRLLGAVDDAQKHALLAQCDLFCLASRERTEAFGLVLLEAMQHARPCLVTDLPGSGMPWVISQAQCGLHAPLENVPGWRQAITQLQNDPALRNQYGQAGQQALQRLFSITACERQLLVHYTQTAPEASHTSPHKDVLIVIPARNEAATIGTVLHDLKAAGWHDVLVINDQSTDDTGPIARAAGAHVLNPALPVGAWGGMQTGIRHALRHGYRVVITMDADGQHAVEEIPTLLQARHQADLIVGAFPERASQLRQIAWHWFRQLAGFDLRDLTSGFRLYNRNVMNVLASREATLLDYQDLGALLLIRRASLTISEVPVFMNLRMAGKSRIFSSWLHIAKYMAATTLLCLAQEKKRTDRMD